MSVGMAAKVVASTRQQEVWARNCFEIIFGIGKKGGTWCSGHAAAAVCVSIFPEFHS